MLGLPHREQLERMADNDRVWVYLGRAKVDKQKPKVRRLRAIARITGQVQELTRPSWRPRGSQAFSFARPIEVLRQLDTPGYELMGQLSFAGGRKHWGLQLLKAPLVLTEKDEALLASATSR